MVVESLKRSSNFFTCRDITDLHCGIGKVDGLLLQKIGNNGRPL